MVGFEVDLAVRFEVISEDFSEGLFDAFVVNSTSNGFRSVAWSVNGCLVSKEEHKM